jgi:predicted RNase H-like HicB family nuclease
VIHKDSSSDFGIIVPDIPGCFSAAKKLEDAVDEAKEAIACHLEALLMDNEPIPVPTPIEQHMQNPEYEDGIWMLVDVDLTRLSGKCKRVNITLPERILRRIDEHTKLHGGNRSAFLADAALQIMDKKC